MEGYLSVADLATRCNVPLETVYQWNTRGVGPRYLKLGRHVRYRPEDVAEWERSRTVEPLARAGSSR